MKRIVHLIMLSTALLISQDRSSVYILEYRAEASVDEQQSEVNGTVSAWVRLLQDGSDRIQFRISSNTDVNAVRDIDGDRFVHRRSTAENTVSTHTIMLPARRNAGDSVFVKIEFEGTFDTSSYSAMFINQREFLLHYTNDQAWLPQFNARTAARCALTLNVSHSFRCAGGVRHDSVSTGEDQSTWYFHAATPAALSDIFSLCGSSVAVEMSRVSADSLTTVSFLVDTARFHKQFADSLLSYLADAAQRFKEMTGLASTTFRQTYVCLGEDDIYERYVRTGSTVIERNSPTHTVFDSALFRRSTRNEWLIQLARRFSLSTDDSTALFDEGFAGYLATRYILSTFPDPAIERRERLDLMINALSFFPTYPLAAGRTARTNEDEVLSFKGRYVFLMLEQILDKEPFADVIKKMYGRFPDGGITIGDFQSLCEEEYGSPLDWFFGEWLHRSSVPEFAVQWRSERTQRGVAVTHATIEQRGDLFTMPLTLVFTAGTKTIRKRIVADRVRQEFTFTFDLPPSSVELDPQMYVLRWLLDIRILAHARSSRMYRIYSNDIGNAEREALLALELDPANTTGSAPLAYFSLGKLSVIQNDPERAKEYFLKAMQSAAGDESMFYPLLSLVRFANVLEMEGRRNEALLLYQRAATEGKRNPALFAPVIVEAEKYAREQFISTKELWYGSY